MSPQSRRIRLSTVERGTRLAKEHISRPEGIHTHNEARRSAQSLLLAGGGDFEAVGRTLWMISTLISVSPYHSPRLSYTYCCGVLIENPGPHIAGYDTRTAHALARARVCIY